MIYIDVIQWSTRDSINKMMIDFKYITRESIVVLLMFIQHQGIHWYVPMM